MKLILLILLPFFASAQLPGSGSLSIKSAAGSSRSISLEVDGNETGSKSLSTLSNSAGFSAPHSMLEFYNYEQCSVAPQPVTDADASVVSNDITITWVPSGLGDVVEQFRIERNSQSTGIWTFVANVPVNGGDQYTDLDLPSDQYQYRVRAENDCGQSTFLTTNSVIVP